MKDEIRKELVGVLKDLKDTTKQLEAELLFTNGTGELIYAVDIETDRIIFMNKTMINVFGDKIGEYCYKALQDFHEHCEFCTNHIIVNNVGVPYKWYHHNKRIDKYFFIVDVCKIYNGRKIRIEKAYEIDKDTLRQAATLIE